MVCAKLSDAIPRTAVLDVQRLQNEEKARQKVRDTERDREADSHFIRPAGEDGVQRQV